MTRGAMVMKNSSMQAGGGEEAGERGAALGHHDLPRELSRDRREIDELPVARP